MATIKPEAMYAPRAAGDTVSILSFTAEDPTHCEVSQDDGAKLMNGDTLMLSEFTGANDDLNGSLGIVANKGLTDFQLEGVDMTGRDVDGLTASGIVTDAFQPPPTDPELPPAPPPPPEADAPPPWPLAADWAASPTPQPLPDPQNPYPSPGSAVGYYPSPGIGPVPVWPHPMAPDPGATAAAQEPAVAPRAPNNVLTANDVVQQQTVAPPTNRK